MFKCISVFRMMICKTQVLFTSKHVSINEYMSECKLTQVESSFQHNQLSLCISSQGNSKSRKQNKSNRNMAH